MIRRRGFAVAQATLRDGKCPCCATVIPGRFQTSIDATTGEMVPILSTARTYNFSACPIVVRVRQAGPDPSPSGPASGSPAPAAAARSTRPSRATSRPSPRMRGTAPEPGDRRGSAPSAPRRSRSPTCGAGTAGSDPTGVRARAAPARRRVPTSKDDGLPVLIVGLLGLMILPAGRSARVVDGKRLRGPLPRAAAKCPRAPAVPGKIVGIVGTVLLVLSIVGFALSVVAQCR